MKANGIIRYETRQPLKYASISLRKHEFSEGL